MLGPESGEINGGCCPCPRNPVTGLACLLGVQSCPPSPLTPGVATNPPAVQHRSSLPTELATQSGWLGTCQKAFCFSPLPCTPLSPYSPMNSTQIHVLPQGHVFVLARNMRKDSHSLLGLARPPSSLLPAAWPAAPHPTCVPLNPHLYPCNSSSPHFHSFQQAPPTGRI